MSNLTLLSLYSNSLTGVVIHLLSFWHTYALWCDELRSSSERCLSPCCATNAYNIQDFILVAYNYLLTHEQASFLRAG